MMADEINVEATQKVNITVSFQFIPHKTFNVEAFVINGIPVDILLGLDFMNTHEMKLDMTTKTVQIGNNELEFSISIFPTSPPPTDY